MILNLLRVEQIDVEHVIRHSFLEFSSKSSLPGLLRDLNNLKIRHSELVAPKNRMNNRNCNNCLDSEFSHFINFQSLLSRFYLELFSKNTKLYKRLMCPGRVLFADCGKGNVVPVVLISAPSPNGRNDGLQYLKQKFFGISFPRLAYSVRNPSPDFCLYKTIRSTNVDSKMFGFVSSLMVDYDAFLDCDPRSMMSLAHYSYFFVEKISCISNSVLKIDVESILNNKNYTKSRTISKANM